MTMPRYFAVNGYLKADWSPIDGYIVTDDDEAFEGDYDDDIFRSGMTEDDLIKAMQDGDQSEYNFVITHFEDITELYEKEKRQQEIFDYLKENLEIRVVTVTCTDYGSTSESHSIVLVLAGEEISSDSISIDID